MPPIMRGGGRPFPPPLHRVLGVDYSVADFTPFTPLGLTITVEGAFYELCPAASYFGSAASCEYVVSGFQPSTLYGGCCPKGVTSYSSLPRLQGQAGYPAPGWTSTR